MTCLLFHKWTKWSAPMLAETTGGQTHVQRRICKSCEAVDYRRVPVWHG